MLRILVATVVLVLVMVSVTQAASVIVAASNSSVEAKSRADYVCQGKDDQVKLMASFATSGRYSVEWLPGDYYLSGTVILPPANNAVIEAEGTYFHYLPSTGDAIHIRGMLDCRYRFGTIETSSAGAAIRVQNPPGINALMSIVSFTGLLGHEQKGTGLYLDVSQEGICTNRFEGTDISGFDTGIFLGETHTKKTDTNWFFINSVRRCNTCIREMHAGVDDSVFQVTLDTSLPNSVGIRTAARYGKFEVMMSDSSGLGTKALIIEPGASDNVFEFHPAIEFFNWEDNSGNQTNIILSTMRPPYKTIKQPLAQRKAGKP